MVFSKKNSNSIVIFLITAVCLVFTMNLSYIDITIMEARNFVTAREMILENNWLMPTFNGEPRYQKPPLPTWITALSSFMFGFKSLYFYRLPGFLVLAITGITSYYFSLELLNNKRDSIINAIITVTSFYIIAIVIEAPWDIYSHTFMFIAIYYLFRSLNSEVFKLKTAFLASIFIGCSFLSKGPISIYALLIPFLISYFITYPSYVVKKIKKITPILITGLVIGAAWYLFLLIEDPTNLINITKKETSNWSSYNIRPFYYYWSFFIQSGVWAIFAVLSLFYPYYKNKIKEYKKDRKSVV
jgi:4-amino-4-deoxy-L-arabinose transferase-like glycosyltransferase